MRNKIAVLTALMSLLFFGATANSQQICDPVYEGQCPPVNVPEPGTLLLLATGLAGIALARKRRK